MPSKPPISSNDSTAAATAVPGVAETSPARTPSKSRAPNKRRKPAGQAVETGGPKGLEPTRYGDWERKGRCIDF